MKVSFGKAERSGRVVYELIDGHLEIGDPPKVLLHDASLWLERGEHVSLVGANGTGKTTLIRALTGERGFDGGRLSTGHNVKLGYLSQHAEELGETGTVLSACQRHTGLTPNKARALLGQFLFSGEDAEKPLDGLSGGERRRLSLAILVSGGANFLVIDEPTNHLDLESREALEDALRSFDGTVLLVSHDRALLDAVGTRTVAIEDRKLGSYLGGWAEYVRVRDERRAASDAASPKPAAAKPAPAKPAPRSPAISKNRQKRIAQLERDVADAEAALAKLEDELADPSAWASPTGSERAAKRHAEAKGRVESLYEELLALSEE
jgi:ATP-binding cassette subfamily F protein 3